MIHQAFALRLKPGALEEYRRLHRQVPRQVEIDEEEAGVLYESIFEHEGTLFVFSIVRDSDTWERGRKSEAGRRWAAQLTPFLEMGADGLVASVPLTEVYHHEAPAFLDSET